MKQNSKKNAISDTSNESEGVLQEKRPKITIMEDFKTYHHIADLLYKETAGVLTDEERHELDTWLTRHDSQKIKELMHDYHFLQEEYHATKDVNVRKALEEMEERLKREESPKERSTTFLNILKYAAAAVILVVAGASLWYRDYTKVTPPEISQSVQLAMQQSIQSGKQDAVIEEVTVKGEAATTVVKGQDPSQDADEVSEQLESFTKEQLLAAKRITTRHDKEYWVTLDDGSLVHLNYNTRLIYPEQFGRGDRNVILEGEAYFIVAKDRSRPFVVHTMDGDIKVYGTEFNVNTSKGSDGSSLTSVVLVKGSVSVTPVGGKEQMVKPGQQCQFSAQDLDLADVDVSPYVAWNTGEFAFSDVPLEVILSTMSHWYQVDIEYKNEEARKILFTGTIDRYGSADIILRSIGKVTGLDIEQHGNHVIIR